MAEETISFTSDAVKEFAGVLATAESELADRKRKQRKREAAERKMEVEEGEFSAISADRLRSLVERIERLEEERKALGSDIKEIYQEAKSAGFDVKVMRQLIRLRRMEPAEVEEQETLLDLYRRALGM